MLKRFVPIKTFLFATICRILRIQYYTFYYNIQYTFYFFLRIGIEPTTCHVYSHTRVTTTLRQTYTYLHIIKSNLNNDFQSRYHFNRTKVAPTTFCLHHYLNFTLLNSLIRTVINLHVIYMRKYCYEINK